MLMDCEHCCVGRWREQERIISQHTHFLVLHHPASAAHRLGALLCGKMERARGSPFSTPTFLFSTTLHQLHTMLRCLSSFVAELWHCIHLLSHMRLDMKSRAA